MRRHASQCALGNGIAGEAHRLRRSREQSIAAMITLVATPYPFASVLGDSASLVGAAAALLVLTGAVRAWYRRTLGRRRDRYGRLARLGTGAQLSFFASVLGEPPAMQETILKEDYAEIVSSNESDYEPDLDDFAIQRRYVSKTFVVSTFIDRDYYVQTICDEDQTVLAFSVTTRSKRFRPRYQILRPLGPIERWRWRRSTGQGYKPLVDIKLGRTTFAQLDSKDPEHFSPPHFRIAVGAHNHFYSEFAHFGNPGHYQWFVWSSTDAARQGRLGPIYAARQEIDGGEWPDPDKDTAQEPDWSEMPETQRFRQDTVITTYTAVSGALWEENYPLPRFGPHENDVRTLP
jgi:hypothetical protein